MTTITEFLLARITEDEAAAGRVFAHDSQIYELAHYEGCDSQREHVPYPCDCGLTARIIADCKAKRMIVEWCSQRNQIYVGTLGGAPDAARSEDFVRGELIHVADSVVLRHLAEVYADHPDFRETWHA